MVNSCCRRWANIKLTLDQRVVVFSGLFLLAVLQTAIRIPRGVLGDLQTAGQPAQRNHPRGGKVNATSLMP